jgi:diguanylate cyclase (GGDEF)-like protein
MAVKILIIDDDNFILKAVGGSISEEIDAEITTVTTYNDAKTVIESGESFALAIVDLHLPDAEDGDAVVLTVEKQIPTIILTGLVDESLRSLQEKESVIEYVLKSDPNSIPFLVKIVKKLVSNLEATVLIVDDSDLQLTVLKDGLRLINVHNIIEAGDGNEALKLLKENPAVNMVITDYEMPNCNGLQLVESIRQTHHKDSLSIIAMSAAEKKSLAVDFLRMGANDFVSKPFDVKELHTRVNNNLEILWLFKENLEQKKKLQEVAFTDMLTKLHNRTKHLLNLQYYCKVFSRKPYEKEGAGLYLLQLHVEGLSYANMNFGYAKGDEIITSVVKFVKPLLGEKESFARTLSSEFAIIAPNTTHEHVKNMAHEIIRTLERHIVSTQLSFSIGIAQYHPKKGIKKLLAEASKAMVSAQESEAEKVQSLS